LGNYGIFANKDFKKGDITFINTNKVYNKKILGNNFYVNLNFSETNAPLDKNLKNFGLRLTAYSYDNAVDAKDGEVFIAGFGDYLNHSCNANTFEVFSKNYSTYSNNALKDINKGEELTINYNSFIYNYAIPFDCLCKASDCCKQVRGYKNLSEEKQKELQPYLANYMCESFSHKHDKLD